jgi:tetratricopeptide (TPR) repeat protein
MLYVIKLLRFIKFSLNKVCLSPLFKKKLLLVSILSLFLFASEIKNSFGQQQNVDSLISVLQITTVDTSKVKVLNKLSDAYTDTKPDKAIEYANQGLALSKRIDFKKGQSICLNALGLAYYQLGKFDTALVYFENRYEIVSKIKDSLGIAGTFDNMGVIYIHYGKIEKAIELRTNANKIYASLNKRNNLASGYTWIGTIYKEKGEYTIALNYYLKALKIYEEEKNENDIGYPLLNISSVYRYLKQYDQAKRYALDAKTKFSKAKYLKGIGASLYRLALIYDEEKDFINTINSLTEAKKIFEEIQDTYFQSLVNLMLGTSNHNIGHNELALKYFNDVLPIALQIGDKELTSTVFQNIGTVYIDRGEFLKALEYMHKSEKILIGIKDKKSLQEISVNFIELYSRINKPDSVVKYLQIYQQLTDTIFNQQNSKSIAEMQTKYDTEKKDKEIAYLNLQAEKKKNNNLILISGFVVLLIISLLGFINFRNKKEKEKSVLNQRAAELSRKATENHLKALRSQMNPHFIFNCVDSIGRLLDEGKIKESKISLSNFSTLTRTILEGSMKKKIPLAEEIKTLKIYMELENIRFKNPFTYNILLQPEIDAQTTLIPPLILQPFVENSIKHGFRNPEKSGNITIEVRRENEYLVCIVEDNGVGRNQTMNLKPISGFKKESVGMKLTEERLLLISEQKNMKSYFLIDDLEDSFNNPGGTRVKMFLPYELLV